MDSFPLEEVTSELPNLAQGKAEAFPREAKLKAMLHQICRDGDLDVLRSLPQKAVATSVNELDFKGLGPLHYAARYSHMAVMRLLLELGADVDIEGDDNMTPLHYAARYAKRKVRRWDDSGDDSERNAVDFLLNHGAHVNQVDRYDMTALHHAAIRGNVLAVQALLSFDDTKKEAKDVQSSTPLHIASTYGHPEVARLLLSSGCDMRALDSDLRTPLHKACQEGNEGVAFVLLEAAEEQFGQEYVRTMLHDVDEDEATPLLLAVGSGDSDIVKALVERHADVNAVNRASISPVHSAARIGDIASLKILVSEGAAIQARNAAEHTPVYIAAENGHAHVIRYLFDQGADLNLVDRDGFSPLMIAAYEGHLEACQRLLEFGANVNLEDKDDKTVLFHAAEQNRPAILKMLLENDGGVSLLSDNDVYDNLAIHAAAAAGHVECVRILMDAAATANESLLTKNQMVDKKNEDEQTPLHLASTNGWTHVVDLVLKRVPNAINYEDEDSNTSLHLACANNHARVVTRLLHFGADVNNRNTKKWTPLDCAAEVGAYACAKLLLEADAPVDPEDRTKTTPLLLAAQNGHPKVVTLLLEYGANIVTEDSYGRNVLEIAIMSRKKDVVRTILEHPDWRRTLRTTFTVSDSRGTPVPETPTRMLIRIYPQLAGMVFDQCITVERSIEEEGQAMPKSTNVYDAGALIKVDYEFIDDAFNFTRVHQPDGEGERQFVEFTYCPVDSMNMVKSFDDCYNTNRKVIKDNHPLTIMANQKRKDLLRHPLCLALVRFKWRQIGRYVFYAKLLLYILFLTFLTSYVLMVPSPAEYASLYENPCGTESNNNDATIILPKRSAWERGTQIGIIITVAIQALFEFMQFYRAGTRYFQLTNLIDWTINIFSLLLVVDVENSAKETGFRECWQWEIGCLVIVMAWLNLLGEIRTLPFLGIYIIMFLDIFRTMIKFSVVFLIFIVAFSLGFHMLLLTREGPFSEPGSSLLKTFVMMLGELEYESLFYPENDSDETPYPTATTIVFTFFLVVMSIIIVNLLVGLAVDDIQAVQEEAVLKRLALQVELVLDVERMVPSFILKRFYTQIDYIERHPSSWYSIYKDVSSSKNIIRDVTNFATGPDLQEVIQRQDQLEASLKKFKAELTTDNRRLRTMLVNMAEQSNVELSPDDIA